MYYGPLSESLDIISSNCRVAYFKGTTMDE